LTEGKFSTTGIYFNPNSASIKPESYAVLKEVADVLKENQSMNITIIGHTDADGDDQYNLELSKKRSQSVKHTLANDFGIAEGRMKTDGKGESNPVSDNNTPSGKAANRRVEFIRQ
jgi:outer membrane protein OmpA-like peptidoglycan-associated protein